MTARNWKNAFQHQGNFNGPIVQMLQDLETDLTTALAAISSDHIAFFTHSGAATAGAGVGRYLFRDAAVITAVIAACNTAPAGADLILDINKNGTTIFTTQANRPRILDGAHATASTAVPDVTSVVPGDYLTVDIDQPGAPTPAADITVEVYFA